jgi:putative ABC transport system permease protein
MLGPSNIKMAREAIKSSRWRSMLTMLGVVIGIVSVVTIVSLGEGAKQRIVGQINHGGSDLITVRPGRLTKQTSTGVLTGLFGGLNTGFLSEADYATVDAANGVKEAIPFAYINGIPKSHDREFIDAMVIATTDQAPQAINQKLNYGAFFTKSESDRDVAIVGKRVAEQLFQENVPIGKLFTIRGRQFVVRGVFEEFDVSPLVPNADYNNAIFIPYESGKKLDNGQVRLYQVLARPESANHLDQTAEAIRTSLANTHSGQVDFTVLLQQDIQAAAQKTLDLLTGAIGAIAAIALVVAGIGIMNIMLVSVTERTREIGVRKAIGATNRQILGQFLTEAALLSLTGGMLGILFSLLTNYLLRVFTNLTPVLTWQIIVFATIISMGLGIVFGIMPALKAARMRPIDALRHE